MENKKFELKYCDKCIQMTNFIGSTCQKCGKQTRRKRCDICNRLLLKEQVLFCANPYEEDINGVTLMSNMCNMCYQDCVNDI